jgi:pimeloyl-ACP methyl ester carboxylesterase
MQPHGAITAISLGILGVVVAASFTKVFAQEPPMAAMNRSDPDRNAAPKANFNLSMGTFGGKQFWTDFVIQADWRIQQNIYTGHFRLLSPQNTRIASGNYAHCWSELEKKINAAADIPSNPRQAIVLLHGLARSRSSMASMATYLQEHTDALVINFSYASTRATLSDHAHALHHMLNHLAGVEEVSFVCHSLGNLVVRRMLDEYEAPPSMHFSRMVMLGPPNLGAQLASRFRKNILFNLVWGPSGKQLAQTWHETEPHLATPDFEFGVLAGGGGDSKLSNPLIQGDDDLVVSVEETRLPGAADFRRVAAYHTWLMSDGTVQQLTLHFLQHGYFESEASRDPIPKNPKVKP